MTFYICMCARNSNKMVSKLGNIACTYFWSTIIISTATYIDDFISFGAIYTRLSSEKISPQQKNKKKGTHDNLTAQRKKLDRQPSGKLQRHLLPRVEIPLLRLMKLTESSQNGPASSE